MQCIVIESSEEVFLACFDVLSLCGCFITIKPDVSWHLCIPVICCSGHIRIKIRISIRISIKMGIRICVRMGIRINISFFALSVGFP